MKTAAEASKKRKKITGPRIERSKRNIILFLALVLIFVTVGALLGRPSFDSEKVTIKLNGTVARVEADFFVASRLPVLFISFPRNELMTNFRVFDDGREIDFSQGKDYYFPILFNPFSPKKTVSVSYDENFTGRSEFTYIVLTARTWGNALDRADFYVDYPKSWNLTSATYPVDRTVERDGFKEAAILEEQFFPDRDLTISFDR